MFRVVYLQNEHIKVKDVLFIELFRIFYFFTSRLYSTNWSLKDRLGNHINDVVSENGQTLETSSCSTLKGALFNSM